MDNNTGTEFSYRKLWLDLKKEMMNKNSKKSGKSVTIGKRKVVDIMNELEIGENGRISVFEKRSMDLVKAQADSINNFGSNPIKTIEEGE